MKCCNDECNQGRNCPNHDDEGVMSVLQFVAILIISAIFALIWVVIRGGI
jgi:hypothetical protein